MVFVRRVCIVALACFLGACDLLAPPVDHSTAFDVVSIQTSDTCGPQAVSAPSQLRFVVRFAVSQAGATWTVPASGAMAQGSWDPTTQNFQFTSDGYTEVRPADRWAGRAACVIRRLDVVNGVLVGTLPSSDAGVANDVLDANPLDAALPLVPDDSGPPPSFSATETILYGPVAGADCSDQIGASNGQYSTLPCQITYTMTAAESADGGR